MPDSTNDHAKAELESHHAASHFRFADLPPELRNLVYQKCLEDVKMRLPRPKSGDCCPLLLTVDSPLVLLNKKFGEESKDFARTTTNIETTVANYDFEHVYFFLRSCGTSALRRLESGLQIFTIELSFPGNPSLASKASKSLTEWIRAIGENSRNGSKFNFRYMATLRAQIKTTTRSWVPDHLLVSRALRTIVIGKTFPLPEHDTEHHEAEKMRRALLALTKVRDAPSAERQEGFVCAPSASESSGLPRLGAGFSAALCPPRKDQ